MSRGAFTQREHPHLVGAAVPQDAADLAAEVEAAVMPKVVVVTASLRHRDLPPDRSDRFSLGRTPE